jgi:serine/threonine protein kinase
MAAKELRKSTENALLRDKFAKYALVTKGSSNNGFFYVLSEGVNVTYVKVVDAELEDEEGLDETKLCEMSSSSKHVATLISSGDIDGKYKYLQFEYIKGKALPVHNKQMASEDLDKLARTGVRAISDIWKNKIVHRDIKPGNIMVTESGEYKLVDFGIGYFMESQDRDNTKSRGSRYYSSPEQFFSTTDRRVEVTFSSDLYSLGMVLFEQAAGQHPKENWPNKSCYGEVITQTPPPKIEEYRTDLSKELTAFINKLLAVYPVDRFLSPKLALDFLDGKVHAEQPSRLFIHDTSSNYSVINSYLAGGHGEAPSGVVVSLGQGINRIKDLRKLSVEVIVDPMTFRLPHPLASNSNLKNKLGYKKKVLLDGDRIRSDITSIIRSTLQYQIEATSFVLPYFAIESLDDSFVEINKLVWRIGSTIAKEIDSTKKVYGGLAIAQSITTQIASVDKMVNLFLGQYPIDGFYIVFEAPNDSPKTIDLPDFLNGVRKITEVMKSMGRVIVAYSDISYLFVAHGVDLAIGWSNSKRRFLYSHELKGEKSGFLLPEYDPKLLYYTPQLVTFIKGEDEAEAIYKFAAANSLDCTCANCVALSPFDGQTPKDMGLAELHYYKTIIDQLNAINVDPEARKETMLRSAATIASGISRSSGGTVGSKIIPSHESILGVINK